MSEIAAFERVLWGLSFCLNFALVFLLLYRKNYRIYPCFLLYTVVNLFQGVVLFASLQLWRYHSSALFKIGWATQGLVLTARALSVAELCRHVLAKYRGIWGLGWRLAVAGAAGARLCGFGRSDRRHDRRSRTAEQRRPDRNDSCAGKS